MSAPRKHTRTNVLADDPWTWREPVSDDELEAARADSLAWLNREDHTHEGPFTCDDCPRKAVCVLAFDPYNTEGDCLYDK